MVIEVLPNYANAATVVVSDINAWSANSKSFPIIFKLVLWFTRPLLT